MPKTSPIQPLARSTSDDILDWDRVDARKPEMAKDVLGLSTADRQALGLSAPPLAELQAPTLGGAETALAELLARGGAFSATRGREPYRPSGAVGRSAPRRKA